MSFNTITSEVNMQDSTYGGNDKENIFNSQHMLYQSILKEKFEVLQIQQETKENLKITNLPFLLIEDKGEKKDKYNNFKYI